jgi:CheY-like chemotaxis protein
MTTILVVDDDDPIRALVASVLQDEGYQVATAATGEEALAALEQGRPLLVITDMRMPVMDGWEFAAELRARFDEQIPLLVMTAAYDPEQRAAEIGASGTIGKPFDLDDLVRAVEKIVGTPEQVRRRAL